MAKMLLLRVVEIDGFVYSAFRDDPIELSCKKVFMLPFYALFGFFFSRNVLNIVLFALTYCIYQSMIYSYYLSMYLYVLRI